VLRKNRFAIVFAFFLASVAIVNCNGETSNMKKNHSKEVRSSPVLVHVKPVVKSVLGEDYRQRVDLRHDSPKGLIRDEKLMVAPDSKQIVKIYGDLTEAEMQSIHEKLFQQLRQVRDDTYAPVILEFYRLRGESSTDQKVVKHFIFPEAE